MLTHREAAPARPKEQRKPGVGLYLRVAAASLVILGAVTFLKYAHRMDEKLRDGLFSGACDFYAAAPAGLIASVSEKSRETRKPVRFDEIPKTLVDAVVAVEDKRFFHHHGLDPLRMAKAAYVDLRDGRKDQGASTLTMQLARSLLLDRDKNWSRKAIEIALALRLEQKLGKQQIFEYYCNQVYLGQRGAFSLHGFGAAARAYFGKDVPDLTLPEAAALAGLIHRPSYYHPFRNVDRLLKRRNVALGLMLRSGSIGAGEYKLAVKTPLVISAPVQSGDSDYFIDLAVDELRNKLDERAQGDAPEIYTTLDAGLQRAANDSVRIGLREVDEQLRKRMGKGGEALPQVEAALVALDPRTGEVKALVGGRDYAASQLNRALASRQPGSVFKPFVYAAALETALQHRSDVVTPATLISDEPTTFWDAAGTPYQPGNFGHPFAGEVTVREALAKSMNIPTVKLAQMISFHAVSQLARLAGVGDNVQPTPSIALGSYETTPLDIAGAYSIFANHGLYVRPSLIREVKARNGQVIYIRRPETRQVLDPRVAYLMVNLMEEVLRSGTGAGARSRGFYAPAAGKTGTSRDGWFAGFTSQLLCVVWVGFDDNRELKLEGARSALPIWTEFMKRALQIEGYRDARSFRPPSGITSAQIDPETGLLASPNCPSSRPEFFIDGTEPNQMCNLHETPFAAQ